MNPSLKALAPTAIALFERVRDGDHDVSPSDQLQLFQLATELKPLVAPPDALLVDLCWQVHYLVAARLAIDLGIFDAFANKDWDSITLCELQQSTRGDTLLLTRVLSLLVAARIVAQESAQQWRPLAMARMMVRGAMPAGQAGVTFALPQYLEEKHYKVPEDPLDSPLQHCTGRKETFWEHLASNPDLHEAFTTLMVTQSRYRGQDWFDFFPVTERLMKSESEYLLVDIAGGAGQDLIALKNRYPHLRGTMVLQDLPSVVDRITGDLPPGIEVQKHDMFQPQPVKGAKVYYMRTVLHDWPDKQALLVLARIREAMTPDSILLLNDNIVVESQAPPAAASVDLLLMTCFAARERSEEDWIRLLEAADFQVVQVWKPNVPGMTTFALFEARPVA